MMSADPLRILFVAPYVPSRIRVRPFQIIRHLAKMGHQITLVALDEGLPHTDVLEELRTVCEQVHIVPHSRLPAILSCLGALPTPTPLWAAYCRSARMEALLRKLVAVQTFEIAHVEHLRAAHFAAALGAVPKIIDAVDCITALRRQILDQGASGLSALFSWEEWTKLRVYEPRAYRAFSRIAVTAPQEASLLAGLDPMRLPPVDVIPNGVDLSYFSPEINTVPEPNSMVFSGKLSYIANDDAACFLVREVLPAIRRRQPSAQLIVAGSGPTRRLRQLAANAEGVTLTGYVEDLRPYLRKARLAVCPLRIGVGIQNKVLEAMAMGLPVVASSLAARAITRATANGALMVADGPEEIAAACVALLQDPVSADRAGIAARAYVEAHHHWETTAEMFTHFYHMVRCG